MWVATGIFIAIYVVIISEKVHRTVIALLGAVIFIIAGFIPQEGAIEAIDFNTIGLLAGMMMIVAIARQSGMFEFAAVYAARVACGSPVRIMVYLAVLTAIASALLDNVTTVLLVVPVTIMITKKLDINPFPFFFTQIFASNIGGTATLIGDPPNIMIGSRVGLSFMDFVINLAPVVVIIMFVMIPIMVLIFRKSMNVSKSKRDEICALIPTRYIHDYLLLKKSLFVLAIVILGFFFHGALHLESATIALFGAALLLLISKLSPDEVLLGVEWPTLFFFLGLFVMVGTLEHLGIIELMAKGLLTVTGTNVFFTTMLILWVSAVASAIIDNIPFVATMIPLILDLGRLSGMDIMPLWWALALGACLGGNGTLIGASANVVVAGIAERHENKFTFMQYTKLGFPLMLITIAISTVYMWLVFFVF